MITKVIAAFPGTGKSYFVSHAGPSANIIDLDSNSYTFGYTHDGKVRNPDFPNNYIRAIKEHLGKADILFTSCQPETIATLQRESIPFTLVYPQRALQSEYIERFKQRGSAPSFINLLASNWDIFLDFLESQSDCEHIVLAGNQYLSNIKF